MQTSTRALLSLEILVFLSPSGLLADEDSLFSIQDSAVVGTDVTERFLASHYVKKFTIVTIDTNRLREEIRTASLIRNTGDAHPLKFNLFEDLSFTLRPTLVQDVNVGGAAGLASWAGQLEPEADFFASVALHLNANNEVEGSFRTSLGRIRVEPTEELPYHIVWLQDFETELDGSKLFETPRESESKDSRVNSSDASGQMSPGFLIDVDEAQLDKGVLESFLQSKPPIARYRLVQVDADTFRTVIRDPTPGLESVIQLFDNERITVKTIQQREHVSGLQTGIGTWLGKVVGQDASTVQMVIAPDGGVEATFLTSSGRYRLEGIGLPPYHVVWQMDPNATAVTD